MRAKFWLLLEAKKAVKGKEKPKEDKLKPSDDELRSAICDILKEVDFNTVRILDLTNFMYSMSKKSIHYLYVMDDLAPSYYHILLECCVQIDFLKILFQSRLSLFMHVFSTYLSCYWVNFCWDVKVELPGLWMALCAFAFVGLLVSHCNCS